MPKVGSYEILDEAYLSKHGSVFRATLDGETGIFAVKRFGLPMDDPSEPHWELQTFLDRARVQQMLVAGGARRWAPIYDLGIDGDWAYYATDFYPFSTQKLIDERISLKSVELHALVLGIVQGLSELKALRNRSHGNLKPGNILLAGDELPSAPVLLTDPATNAQAAKSGEAGDLRGLGQLIYEMVMQQVRPASQWPLMPAPQWGTLGSHGESWRKLCNDLLNPDPAARPKLPIIAQTLQTFRSRRRLRLRKFFAAAAILGALGGGAVAIISELDHSVRAQFCQARRDWFGKFMNAASDPARQQRWQADPDLKRIVADANIPAMRAIDCNPRRLIRWKLYEYYAVRDALATTQIVAGELPFRWQKAQQANEIQKRFLSRGWTQPADYLASLIDGTQPAANVDVAAGIDRLLAASPKLQSGLKLADEDWKLFTVRIKAAETPRDPMLTELAKVLSKSAASEVHLTDAGFTGLDELNRDANLADELAKVIADLWPTNVDREPFDRDVAKAIDVKHVRKQDLPTWLAIVKYHAIRHDEALSAASDLRKRLGETLDLVSHSHVSADEAGLFEVASREATVAIGEFEQAPFTRRTLDDGTFARQRDQVRNRIEALRRFYHPEGPEQWLDALPAVATASNRINSYWESWRKVLRGAMPEMLRDTNVFKSRQHASEQLRSLLVYLDQTFPPTPPIPNDAFMAAGKLRRESAIDGLLPGIDLREPQLDPAAVRAAVESFSKWTTDLVALNHDFPINKEVLGPGDFVDEKWKKKPEFWTDPAITALVKDDVARLGRLRSLQTAGRQDLIKTINGGGEAELALAAWRILGGDSIRPPWPASSDELATESRFRLRLSAALKGLKDPTEADGPTRELIEQAPIRWRRFVENATSEIMLQNAWNIREEYGVDDKELGRLAATSRYNLALSRLRQATAAGDDAAVHEALAGLSASAAELKNRPEVARLAQQISRVSVKEPFSDVALSDVFNFTLPGVTAPAQFKRVEPASARPFYLCTTDVSMGQFTAVIDAMHAWPQARQLPWPCEIGKQDARRGPRTWEWGGPPASPMSAPLVWLAPEEYNDFAPSLLARKFQRMLLSDAAGGNPSPEHPMQYVSGQVALLFAGLCGCRLPTPAEWQQAYGAYEKSVSVEGWNLRDQTWEAQRRYVATGGGSRWPDEGIFPAAIGIAAVGRLATSRAENDGALYFQPVNAARGNVFHHLVGNVAEFVCDAPQANQLGATPTTAVRIRQFIEQYPKSLYVIGGSALSAPEAPLDKPLPVTRTEEAYADVGFRLAFTAPARNLAEKVKWAIGDPPYFWPKSVAAAADRR